MKKSILLALAGPFERSAGLRAADFWEKKEYKQWKPKDVHKMLTKSPWSPECLPSSVCHADEAGGIRGRGH